MQAVACDCTASPSWKCVKNCSRNIKDFEFRRNELEQSSEKWRKKFPSSWHLNYSKSVTLLQGPFLQLGLGWPIFERKEDLNPCLATSILRLLLYLSRSVTLSAAERCGTGFGYVSIVAVAPATHLPWHVSKALSVRPQRQEAIHSSRSIAGRLTWC